MADVVVERYDDADRDAARAVVLAGLEEHWGSLDPELNRDVDDLGTVYADGVVVVARAGEVIELECRKGASGRFRAVEVPVEQREPIITAYRAKAGRTVEVYWRKRPDPVEHPTFRLEPA